MNRSQLENIYLANGLTDFKLMTTDDLLKVHGIDYKAVDGYNKLDDLNKVIYERFIINFFNGQGLDYRDIVPKGIYFVEDITKLAKDNPADPSDKFYSSAGSIIKAIDKNGVKTVLHSHKYKDYQDLENFEDLEETAITYLRFEYEHQGRAEWLHIVNDGKEWY